MDAHFARHLKLALAVSLLCLWCALVIFDIVDSPLLLILASMVQWPLGQFTTPMVWKWREGLFSLLFLASLFLLSWAVSTLVSEEAFKSFWHNPLTVAVFWVVGIVGLVRQATSAQARMAPNNFAQADRRVGTAV